MPPSKDARKAQQKARREEKKRPDPASDDDDDDDDDESEEEQVEPEHIRRRRQRGRTAFLRLIRRFLSLIPLAVVLSRQPFMVKPRAPGVNSGKLRPIDVAVAGAVHFAAGSPTFIRNPKFHVYLNTTGRFLLTPFEYFQAQQSKRAMPAEKTLSGAYKKSEKAFGRMVDRDLLLKEIVTAPQPNLPLIGSCMLILGVLLCPLAGGIFEYLIVIGW